VLSVRDNACARCRALGDDTDIVNDSQSVVGAGGWQVYLRNIIRENAENILVFGCTLQRGKNTGHKIAVKVTDVAHW
jgi:hypothetical protein